MKKILIPLMVLFLSACASIGPSPAGRMSFPDVPTDLKTACTDLQQVDPNTTKLSDALDVVSANYSQYYMCKDKVDGWINWYNAQQQIYNSVK